MSEEKAPEQTMYQKELPSVYQELETQESGLTTAQAQKATERYGYNELAAKKKDSVLKLFFATFKDAMVIVLLIVAVVQVLMGSALESLIIFAVLLLNSVVSVVQTKKAESSLDALRELSSPMAKVVRAGEKVSIPAREVVPGDIVLLDAGDYVPADGRLIDAGTLKIDEGMLTGESEPAEKKVTTLSGKAPVGDRVNMVHSGTLVVYGRGTFVVTGTGNQTEIGQVAALLENAQSSETPLQRNLNKFSQKLGLAILALSVLILVIQVIRIFLNPSADLLPDLVNAFMFAVAVAVAAIPEALQSIVTIVLSLGTKQMAKQHAIIRKLPAVETLGSTSVICTDKTGTLTQNKMTVVDQFLPQFKDQPYASGSFADWSPTEQRLLEIAVLANDSAINEEGQELGDPTEVALIAYSNKLAKPYEELRQAYPRLGELPFDSDRKLMSTVHEIEGKRVLLTKGGPDIVFGRSTQALINGEVVPFDETLQAAVREQNETFSDRALRVLAFGYKELTDQAEPTLEDEHDLIFVGLLAMIDPPREEVFQAVIDAKSAGMKTVMITGDHKTTARAIAREIGIFEENDRALTGQELDDLSDEQLAAQLESISVYARVSPENKIRIVRAWQEKGNIAAMTGDGVNDAPALKQADIGIAMGSGTDVAKDAAAMVLTDDNFVSIVQAVKVGRNVYDNIKKSIAYLFAGNLGAIIAIIVALIMDWVNPFTALQLLFINLVNDSIPAIALGMEKSEPDVMKRKPRDPNEGIFAGNTLRSVTTRGIFIGLAVIVGQWIGLQTSNEMGIAMAFSTLILARTLQTFPARSNTQTAIGAGFFSNKAVLYAVTFCGVLYGVTLIPAIRGIFSIPASFGWAQFGTAFGLALAAIVLMEVTKLFYRKKA